MLYIVVVEELFLLPQVHQGKGTKTNKFPKNTERLTEGTERKETSKATIYT